MIDLPAVAHTLIGRGPPHLVEQQLARLFQYRRRVRRDRIRRLLNRYKGRQDQHIGSIFPCDPLQS